MDGGGLIAVTVHLQHGADFTLLLLGVILLMEDYMT